MPNGRNQEGGSNAFPCNLQIAMNILYVELRLVASRTHNMQRVLHTVGISARQSLIHACITDLRDSVKGSRIHQQFDGLLQSECIA